MARAQRIRYIPADPHENDLWGEMGTFETDHHRRLPHDVPLLTGEDHTSNKICDTTIKPLLPTKSECRLDKMIDSATLCQGKSHAGDTIWPM
jgi:hypothetical protein